MALGRRLAREELLGGRRGRIVELLRGEPGLAFLELQHRTGIRGGVLTYHLEVLERFGVIASLRMGRCRRYYAVGTVPAAERVAHAMRLTSRYAGLIAALEASPGASQGALASALGVSRQTVSYRLRRLAAARAWDAPWTPVGLKSRDDAEER